MGAVPTPDSPGRGAPGCASCSTLLLGPYCHVCGERSLRDDEYSIRRLLADSLRDAFSLDARLWRSFRDLVARPGSLTVAFMQGRRRGVMGPVQLFITANVIYFFLQPFTGIHGYNTPLDSHMERQFYSGPVAVASLVEAEISRRAEERTSQALHSDPAADPVAARREAQAVEAAVYPARFNERGEVYARSLVFIIIPFLAAALALVYAGKGFPLVQHLVFATHLHAWHLSVFLLGLGAVVQIGLFVLTSVSGMTPMELYAYPIMGPAIWFSVEYGSMTLVGAYVYLGLRQAYGDGRLAAALRSAAVMSVAFAATAAYRFLLFVVTFATT